MDVPPIDEILGIVRTAPDAAAGWERLRKLCERLHPSPLWGGLGDVVPPSDVASARAWLREQLRGPQAPKPSRGLYLGLDTINMDDGGGSNVDLAATSTCDPAHLDMDWTWSCDWHGDAHLIDGLLVMKRTYERRKWKGLYDFADYTLFLGYSGLVLAEALNGVGLMDPFLVVWGFHDGDMFYLGRGGGSRFERLAAIE